MKENNEKYILTKFAFATDIFVNTYQSWTADKKQAKQFDSIEDAETYRDLNGYSTKWQAKPLITPSPLQ